MDFFPELLCGVIFVEQFCNFCVLPVSDDDRSRVIDPSALVG